MAALSRRPTTGSFAASDGTDSLSKRPSRVINVDKRTTLLCEHIEVASILLPPTQPAPKRPKASSVSGSGGGWKSIANSFKAKPMPEAKPGRPNHIPIAAAAVKPKTDLVSSSSAPANPCPALTDALAHRSSKVNFAPLPPAPERGRSPSVPSYGVSSRCAMIRGTSAPPGSGGSSSSNLPGYNAQVARGGFSQLGGLSEADMVTWKDLVRGTKKMCTKLAKGEVASGGRGRKGSQDESDEEEEEGVGELSDDNYSDTESSAPKTPPQLPIQPTPSVKSMAQPQSVASAPVARVPPPTAEVVPKQQCTSEAATPVEHLPVVKAAPVHPVISSIRPMPLPQPQPTIPAPVARVSPPAPSTPMQAATVTAPSPAAQPTPAAVVTDSSLELQHESELEQVPGKPTKHKHRRSIDATASALPPPVPLVQARRGSLTKSMLALAP